MNRYQRVLVVDDEPAMVNAVGRLLRRLGVLFATANDGAQALRALDEAIEPFDLVLSDVRMPVMDGTEFIRRLRSDGRHQTDVVFLTGFSESSREELLAMGAQAVLSKPASREMLVELIQGPGRAAVA